MKQTSWRSHIVAASAAAAAAAAADDDDDDDDDDDEEEEEEEDKDDKVIDFLFPGTICAMVQNESSNIRIWFIKITIIVNDPHYITDDYILKAGK